MKQHFTRSIGRPGAPLHFAAHSHHPWPDVTFQAQQAYWQDSAALLDKKWNKVFAEVIPAAQAHIASHLKLSDPQTIVFATNTHELLNRLLSATHGLPKHNILSTDSEFHSFTRQLQRLEEDELASVVRVPVEPRASFASRFIEQLRARDDWDIVWFSHVFFNSGHVLTANEIRSILDAIEWPGTFAVIDGYHAFMACPVDLSAIEGRAFYIAGGYKYAMAGEGACFMHCPEGFGERPRNTGWYAEFADLEAKRPGQVAYGKSASRFAGATFDPSGLYRLNAVMDWLTQLNLTVAAMQHECKSLQSVFVDLLDDAGLTLTSSKLVCADLGSCGRFLTFHTGEAARIAAELESANIIVDHRADRLRIGFGIYQDRQDVARLVEALARIAR